MTTSTELLAGLKQGVLLGLAVVALVVPPLSESASGAERFAMSARQLHTVNAPRGSAFIASTARLNGRAASEDARFIADWVASSGDNAGMPFVILDKRNAAVFVFNASASLIDASPVLLGAAAGDDSVAGIGARPMHEVKPQERTTPAGRFVSMPGRNASGEDVVWVDYDAAVSMHRVRVVDVTERRLERLASPDVSQRRISYGCINVPVAFYESVIRPVLGATRAVVYVLPESKSLREVFDKSYPVRSRMVRTPSGRAGRAA